MKNAKGGQRNAKSCISDLNTVGILIYLKAFAGGPAQLELGEMRPTHNEWRIVAGDILFRSASEDLGMST